MNKNNFQSPPKWLLQFFRWFCHPDFVEDIEGDLCERFTRKIEEDGARSARFSFLFEVLRLFRPSLMKSFIPNNQLITIGMFKHNLLISYRGFLRNKTSFLINLIGLSTGLACTLLISLWVNDELNIDRFHAKDNQLYQVMTNFYGPDAIDTWDVTPLLLGQTFIEEFPEVESATLTNDKHFPKGIISHKENTQDAKRIFADERFFEVFSYKLLQGDNKQVLADKNSIVISEKLALQLFNSSSNVIGKIVEWKNPYFKESFQISGVFENISATSTKQFDVVFHYDWLVAGDRWAKGWGTNAAETYLILQEGTNIEKFNKQIEYFIWSKVPDRNTNRLFVQKYSEKYLNNRFENGAQAGGRITYVRLFSIIAIFILLIACINFMNLSTAQASQKMKEIGVKKTMGASRNALIFQFLSESLILVILSFIAAIGLVLLLLPQFNEITGKLIEITLEIKTILSIVGIVLFTGIVAGSYPAFYLSSFKPISILQGKRNASLGGNQIRKSLVVFQFALSVIFIVGVLVVDQQMQYIQSGNPGYSRENVISFQRPRHNDDLETFMTELQRIPGVTYASNIVGDFLTGWDDQGGYSWRGQESDKKWIFQSPEVGFNLIETLDMEVLKGRSFSRDFKDDDFKIVINESARKMMKLDNPIGKIVDKDGRQEEIIGVVANFHYGTLHHEVKPLIFRLRHYGRNMMIKIQPGAEKETIEAVEKVYAEFHPDNTFNFTFLDEDNQLLYESENRVAALSKYFSLLAIIISCLGLFGLATFTAERRTKEIGIRKILGSSPWEIVNLLSRDFTKMVGIAILIALPISYVISKNWLENFAYRIDLQWWIFGSAALATLVIAWLTVGFQTLKVAHINPAQCLRDE